MARPVSVAYRQRNTEIVDLYVADQKQTMWGLAARTGLSRGTIRRILETAGVALRSEPRKPKINSRFKNNHLVMMGARISYEKTKRGLSTGEMAVAIGMCETNFVAAMQGAHNWQFSEMVRAAQFLGITLEELIKLPEGMPS